MAPDGIARTVPRGSKGVFMKLLVNKDNRRLIFSLGIILATFAILAQIILRIYCGNFSLPILLLSLCLAAAIILTAVQYLKRQSKLINCAIDQTTHFLTGVTDEGVACDEEGEIYCLFQAINNLETVLSAKNARENKQNEFLRNTISDISHQLKTPLAAMNIYNELISEADNSEDIQRFTAASEGELNRMEMLVKNLLKLACFDAGSVEFVKKQENMATLMADIKARFECRTVPEEKEITLSGTDAFMPCDASWLTEAFSNIVKNALDHTKEGGQIDISWKMNGNIMNVTIRDNGSGIHPEDMPYIFKRFYRSKFSQDTQGIGLGLPLAKEIIDAHGGVIEVDSELGRGSVFHINFVIPTKL